MDIAKQRFAARAAWMAWWNAVRPESGPVTVAMPWRTVTEGTPHRSGNVVFALDGRQRTFWLGFDPDRGLVHAHALWDPLRVSRPPLPVDGWRPCNGAFFDTPMPYRTSDGNEVVGHRYALLPMPWKVVREQGVDMEVATRECRFVQDLPLERFVEVTGISPRALALHQLAVDEDGGITPRIGRSSDFVDALLRHAGNCAEDPVTPAEARPRRAQAVEAMPCFATSISSSSQIRRAIDLGHELVPLLAGHLGCQPSTVRVLGAASAVADGRTLTAMRRALLGNPVMPVLEGMPRSTLRSMAGAIGEGGWQHLAAMAGNVCHSATGDVCHHFGGTLRPDPGTEGTGWSWLSARSARWAHMHDVVADLVRDLVWPADAAVRGIADRSASRGVAECLATTALVSLGAARLGRVLDDHMAGALRRAAEVGTGSGESWAVPAEPVTASTGQTVRFLSSSAELAHEGLAMGHCVGDYGDACASGRCAIMSIGRWQGEEWHPSSTVELRRDSRGDVVVEQHQGPGNGRPPPGDVEVLGEWMSGLASGETLFDEEALSVLAHDATIDRVLGAAWDTPEAHEARWDRWRRILDVRQRGAGAFLRHALAAVFPADMDSPAIRVIRAAAATVEAYDILMRERALALGADQGIMPLRIPV